MRSRVFLLTMILVAVSFFVPGLRLTAWASDPLTDDSPVGQILYRQDFSEISDYAKSGVKTGTSSAEDAQIAIENGELNVRTGTGRAYTIFPDVKCNASYTIEFTFRFSVSGMENGSFGCMLTCRGDEPTNVTSLVIRGNGMIDDFIVPDDLAKAIRSGLKVSVQIPIEDGAFHRLLLTVGEDHYVLERSSVLMVSPDGWGFTFRNTSAAISEAEIVNGCDYTEKIGDTSSYAVDSGSGVKPKPEGKGKTEDDEPIVEPVTEFPEAESEETAPDTRDRFRERVKFHIPVAVTSASVLTCGFVFRRRRRG